jgi:hypothetical protein
LNTPSGIARFGKHARFARTAENLLLDLQSEFAIPGVRHFDL